MDFSGSSLQECFRIPYLLGSTVDTCTCVSRGDLRTNIPFFLREGGLRILRSVLAGFTARVLGQFLGSCTQVQGWWVMSTGTWLPRIRCRHWRAWIDTFVKYHVRTTTTSPSPLLPAAQVPGQTQNHNHQHNHQHNHHNTDNQNNHNNKTTTQQQHNNIGQLVPLSLVLEVFLLLSCSFFMSSGLVSGFVLKLLFLSLVGLGVQFQCRLFLLVQALIFGVLL